MPQFRILLWNGAPHGAAARLRGARRAISLMLCLAAGGWRGAAAQSAGNVDAFRTAGQGISVGRFLFYPSVSIDVMHNDNIFYQSDDLPDSSVASSGEYIIVPRLMLDLPLSQSRVRLAYAPQFRDYSSDQFVQRDHFSHLFDLEATIRVGRILTLGLRDHYVKGTQEVQQFDPGGEVRFGLVPFVLQEPSAEISLDLGGRQLFTLLPRISSLKFDDDVQTGFYDYERRGLLARYSYRLDPATIGFVTYGVDETDQERDSSFFGDVDVDTRSFGVGLQRSFAGDVSALFALGYETQDYEGGAGNDYSGPVYDVNLAWSASDVYRFSLSLRRHAYASFFVNNNYYLNRDVRVQMLQQIGRSAFWQVGAGFQKNRYADPVDIRVTAETPPGSDVAPPNGLIDVYEPLLPSQGVLRNDTGMTFEVGAGFRFTPALRLFVGYNYESRDSNMEQILAGETFDPFDYNVNRVFLKIEVGAL